MSVWKIYPMFWQGDYPRVTEHRPGVRHEQHEDDDVEEQHVQAAPECCWHGLQHNPAHNYIVCIEHRPISHKNTEEPTRVLPENRHFEWIHYCLVGGASYTFFITK